MTAAKKTSTVGIDQLGFNLVFQEGVMALPRLMPGDNTISLTGSTIKPGYKLKVTYNWDDVKAKGRTQEKAFSVLPADFSIKTEGKTAADVRTYFVSLEAVRK